MSKRTILSLLALLVIACSALSVFPFATFASEVGQEEVPTENSVPVEGSTDTDNSNGSDNVTSPDGSAPGSTESTAPSLDANPTNSGDTSSDGSVGNSQQQDPTDTNGQQTESDVKENTASVEQKVITDFKVTLTTFPEIGKDATGLVTPSVEIDGCSFDIRPGTWSEYTSYKLSPEGYFTEQIDFMQASEFKTFRAGKHYMLVFLIRLEGWDAETAPEVYPCVFDYKNLNVTVNAGDHYEQFLCYPWQYDHDNRDKAIVLEVVFVFSPLEYEILEGEDPTFEQGSEEGVEIHLNGDFDLFKELKIDGVVVPKDKYTVREGSTIITLAADYLNSLSKGTHTVSAVYTTDSQLNDTEDEVVTTLTVATDSEETSTTEPTSGTTTTPPTPYNVPNTGDAEDLFAYFVLLALASAFLCLLIRNRKRA